jgi:hypothetical protein
MHPILDYRAALKKRLPDLRKERLRKLGRKHVGVRQRFLVQLLSKSYERRRPHREQRDADAFSRDFLVRGLRASPKADRYCALLEPFYEFTRNHGYSKTRGVTKPYRLRPHVRTALEEVYESDEPVPVVYTDGQRYETSYELPANGVPEGSAPGLVVPATLPIPRERIDDAIGRVREWQERLYPHALLNPTKDSGRTVSDALRLLYACRKWAVSFGGLPNLYREQSHGRLGPKGFNIIGFPAEVRHLLYEGSGMVDFDLRTCFWSIFRSLGRAIGFQTALVDGYASHRANWHARWARLTRRWNPNIFKPVATSWLTGGCLSAYGLTSSAKLVGTDAMQLLQDDPGTRRLYQEVRAGMKRIVEEAGEIRDEGGKKVLVNAVGAALPLDGPRRPSFGSKCAHLLAGYEQFAIREVCQQVEGLQAVIYDGFIAPPQPVEPLEELIRKCSEDGLGFTLDLQLKETDLSAPIPDLEGDPWDF